jgi:hypothetical protein
MRRPENVNRDQAQPHPRHPPAEGILQTSVALPQEREPSRCSPPIMASNSSGGRYGVTLPSFVLVVETPTTRSQFTLVSHSSAASMNVVPAAKLFSFVPAAWYPV